MAATLALAVFAAVVPQQRELVVPDTSVHVQQILAGAAAERRAAAQALAALAEAEAMPGVRALLAAPARAPKGRGGRICSACRQGWDDLGLPVAESYVQPPRWLEDGPSSGASVIGALTDIRDETDPRAIGCWLVEGWGKGSSLLEELCALLRSEPQAAVRVQAARALGRRGDLRAAASLAARLADHAVSRDAVLALARLGRAADPFVFAALRSGDRTAAASALWYVARHAARMGGDELLAAAAFLEGPLRSEALTALVQAGSRVEGLLLQRLPCGAVAAETAIAGLTLLPGRTGPAFGALLEVARDPGVPDVNRALALRYVGESPLAGPLCTELVRLAEAPGNRMVRTAAVDALGRLPRGGAAVRDATLRLAAGDAPDQVRIAALRAAVQCDPSAATRGRLTELARDRKVPRAVRAEARSLRASAGVDRSTGR